MQAEFWKDSIVILDGAFGTVLQQKGLPPGGQPELLNLTDPDLIASVYRSYVEAGSQVVYANTFGANRLKLAHGQEDRGRYRRPGGAGHGPIGRAPGAHGQPQL